MTFYKIIQNDTIKDVGTQFCKWYPRSKKYYGCQVDDAMVVHGTISSLYYHPNWLQTPPIEADAAEEAEVIVIETDEYNELYEQLQDGEEIPVPEPETYVPTEQEPASETEPEHRMTVQEMREKIQELDETLNVILGVVE